jgi:hypothetical protein
MPAFAGMTKAVSYMDLFEYRLKTDLFIRHPRGVTLTSALEILKHHCVPLMICKIERRIGQQVKHQRQALKLTQAICHKIYRSRKCYR